jgi:hypothetical protein
MGHRGNGSPWWRGRRPGAKKRLAGVLVGVAVSYSGNDLDRCTGSAEVECRPNPERITDSALVLQREVVAAHHMERDRPRNGEPVRMTGSGRLDSFES